VTESRDLESRRARNICVAVCCSRVQCGAVRCGVLQCVAMCCGVLRCVAVCCGVVRMCEMGRCLSSWPYTEIVTW